jgi:hypothetical protein
MLEYSSVSASSNDPAALVAQLNDKSAEGWSVVSVVGTEYALTAFLSRESVATSAAVAAVVPVVAAVEPVASTPTVATPVAVEPAVAEPAGWAVAPQPVSQATAQPVAHQVEQPSVPAQWAADPMNRFELRYWDGTRWTEHVSRAGQQYVDPI